MSELAIYSQTGGAAIEQTTDHARISAALAGIGVEFARWEASQPLSSHADQAEVIAAYRGEVDRLMTQHGFQSVDVISLRPDNPNKEALRAKFINEHVHSDFEVRFFVDGEGLFFLHAGDKVYTVLCQAGDLISVPAGVPHWFDMGANPDFKCIRLFTDEAGWVAQYTGSDIAASFPSYEQFVAA